LISLLVGVCASMSVVVKAMPPSLMDLRAAAALPNKPSLLHSSSDSIHVNRDFASAHSAANSADSPVDISHSPQSHVAAHSSTHEQHHPAKLSSSSLSSPSVHSKLEEQVSESLTSPLLHKVLSARDDYLKWHHQNAEAIVKEEVAASSLSESDVEHVQLALRVLELQTQLDMLHYEYDFHHRFNSASNPEFDRELVQTVSLLHDSEQELAVYEANYLKDSMYQEKLTARILALKDVGGVTKETVKDTMALYCDKICDNALNSKLCLHTVHCV